MSFLRLLMLKRSFYQDRLGTNIQGNPLKTEWRFLRYGQWNEQQHLVTYLGIGWSVETLDPNPRFKDEQVVELTKKFNAGNWTVTW
eukprot:COSAG06_NODE_50287_length_319_cov_4.440909_1_plen_85_part_01